MNSKILKNRTCVICGCVFDVELLEGNRIPGKYFYSKGLGESVSEDAGKEIEYWECEKCSGGYMKEEVGKWMIEFWGERCPDYEKDCPLCKAWKCFDYLFGDEE